MKVSVPPDGCATGCSDNYPGSTADITMFRENIAWYKKNTGKINAEDKAIQDTGEQFENLSRC